MNDSCRKRAIPLWLTLGYTAFIAVLVPFYWIEYGPTNFLYFCDVALFLALAALWTEQPIFASMALVGIAVPQLIWQVDFLGNLAGVPLTGMTDYMWDPGITLFARFLSFFHFWLPFLLLYVVLRLGYDRRALLAWAMLAWSVLLVCYFLLPAPGDPLSHPNAPRNVNYVFGPGDVKQTWMPEAAWLALLMTGLPLLAWLPTHLLLVRLDARCEPATAAAIPAAETPADR